LFFTKKTTVDSLLNIANGIKKQPIKRIDALTKLAKLYYRTDSAKTYNYALKAKFEAEKAGYKMGIADAISAMAMYHSSTTNFNKTILLFDKANAIYNSINEENKIAINYNYIGTMYKLVNKYNEALAYSKKAEQVHRR
jgi:adenylate cyclase